MSPVLHMLDQWAFVAGPLSSEDQSYGLSACDVPLAVHDGWFGLMRMDWDAAVGNDELMLTVWRHFGFKSCTLSGG